MADPITQPVNTLPTDSSPQADDTVLTVKTTDGSLVRVALSDIKSLFSVPAASSATPANLGTAAAGSSGDFARADHVHNKPTYSKSDVGLGNVDNVQQYSASNPPPYPVSSVNGQTGAVSLDAEDIGALPDDTPIPTKTSDLTNDSGYITGMEILSYGSSTWADFLAAYNANKVVYCRASSNSNPASGAQNRLAFMAYVTTATNPTSVEFQYYRSVSSHSETQQGDQVFVYTLTSANAWSVTVRETATKIVAGTGLSSSYSSGTLTLSSTGGASGITEETITTSGAVSQALDAGKIYHFTGALTALTITLNAAASGQIAQYHFDFTTGSTVPTLTVPNTVTMPDGFAVEANKRYEIDILNGYGAVMSWAIS